MQGCKTAPETRLKREVVISKQQYGFMSRRSNERNLDQHTCKHSETVVRRVIGEADGSHQRSALNLLVHNDRLMLTDEM